MQVYQPRIPLRYFQIDPAASRHGPSTNKGYESMQTNTTTCTFVFVFAFEKSHFEHFNNGVF